MNLIEFYKKINTKRLVKNIEDNDKEINDSVGDIPHVGDGASDEAQAEWGIERPFGITNEDLDEAFTDLGKLSPEQLQKGQELVPGKRNFHKVDGRTFARALTQIKQNDFARLNRGLPSKGLHTLSVYNVNDYRKMRCFIGINNSSGFALKPDGELVSVFSTQGSSGNAIMDEAVRQGAKYLDCYALRKPNGEIEGPLFKLYSRHGFHINTSMNSGTKGEPYAIVRGVSDYVDDNEQVHPEDPRVVIFMIR